MKIKTHPTKDYEFREDGKFRKVGSVEWCKGRLNPQRRYLLCFGTTVQRAMWRTFKGDIPEGHEIHHTNKNTFDNRIENLACISMKENRALRDFTIIKTMGKTAHDKRRNIKATNAETGEEIVFRSKTQAGKYYGLSPAGVWHRCEGFLYAFDDRIFFDYTDEPVTSIQRTERKVRSDKGTKREKKTENENI